MLIKESKGVNQMVESPCMLLDWQNNTAEMVFNQSHLQIQCNIHQDSSDVPTELHKTILKYVWK